MSTGPKKPVDPQHLEDVHDALSRILRDRRSLQGEIKLRDGWIRDLKEKLRVAEEWQGRLHEKAMALESVPGGVLDAWDEKYLTDREAVITFKRIPGSRKRVVLERRGQPTLVINGAVGDSLLRQLIEDASGRKRSSPQQEADGQA